MPVMECKEVLANLSEYVDRELSADLRQAIEEHVARCRCCKVVLDTTRRTLRIVLDIEPFQVPVAVSARLYMRLEKVLFGEAGAS